MNAVALVMLLAVVGASELQPQIQEGEGTLGARVGYRYVPNTFFAESSKDNDPVVSPYFGSPAVGLSCQYYALATVPVVLDLDWGGERLELQSGGWIDTQTIAVGLASGYQFDVDFIVKPYGLAGVEFVSAFVSDHIASGGTVTGYKATFGLFGALGVIAPGIIPPLPWLAATAELRYTFAPLPQRGLNYLALGIAATVGLAFRFDVSNTRL